MKATPNRARLAPVLMLAALTAAPPASAAIVWNVTYLDQVNGTGVGFDDPTLGATRRATVQSTLNYVNSQINASGVVDLEVQNSETDGTGFLGGANGVFFTGPNGHANGFAFSHATTGIDPAGGPDGLAVFDFGYAWNSGLGAPAAGQADLFSVVLHEVTHLMGYLSLVDAGGNSQVTAGNPGVYSIYDSFLTFFDGSVYQPMFTAPGVFDITRVAALTSGQMFFNGPNAMAANGGQPLKIFAPGTFAPGSSLSHLDRATFGSAVMGENINLGQMLRSYSGEDLGVLEDLGWVLVPEPETVMVWSGAGLVGFALVHRRWKRKHARCCVSDQTP